MLRLLTALIAVAAVAIAATAAFADCGTDVHAPQQPQVQAPPDDGSGS